MLEAVESFLARNLSVRSILLTGVVCIGSVLVVGESSDVEAYASTTRTYREHRTTSEPKEPITEVVPEHVKHSWCRRSQECKTLAEAVVFEARSESEIGKTSIAHVVMNRVSDSRWKNSVRGVVYQARQFSYTTKKQRSKPSQRDWEAGYAVAYDVMHDLVGSPVGNATHYHTKNVRPKWAKRLEYVATVDRHIFYR